MWENQAQIVYATVSSAATVSTHTQHIHSNQSILQN